MKKPIPTALCILFTILLSRFSFAQNQGYSAPGSSEIYNVIVPGGSAGVITFFKEGSPIFAGGSMRYDLAYGLSKNQPTASFVERGRSEVYVDIGLFGSLPTDGSPTVLLFRYIIGLTTSFETPRSLNRNFLVPYMGIELGGVYIEGAGNGFMAIPVLGLNIVTLPTFTMSMDTGLIFNTVSFTQYLGLRSELHINFVI